MRKGSYKRHKAATRRLLEATRKEVQEQARVMDGFTDRMEKIMEEELWERESRRLNLVLHGVLEPGPNMNNPRERMEAVTLFALFKVSNFSVQKQIF